MQNPAGLGKASIGMDANLAAALGYPIGIISIIVLCTEKENKFVKFHALQSLLFHLGAGIVFGVVIGLLAVVAALITVAVAAAGTAAGDKGGGIAGVFIVLVWGLFYILLLACPLAIFVTNIVSAVKSYGGAIFRLPIVGKFAASYAKLDQ